MKKLVMGFAALMTVAAPALAQSNAPTPAPAPAGERMRGPDGPMSHGRFSSLSPEGRQIMRDSLRASMNGDERAKVRDARARVTALLSADKLDVTALRRAMDDERKLVDAQHGRTQEAMIAAFQKLSLADRKAFAKDAADGRDRIEGRMKRMRGEGVGQPGPR